MSLSLTYTLTSLLLAFAVFINIAGAVAIDFYGEDIELHPFSASSKITITFDSRVENFNVPLGRLREPIKIKSASVNKGSIGCKAVNDGVKTYINCNINEAPTGRNTAVIETESSNYIEATGDKNTITSTYESFFDTKSLSVSYKFPERATLSEDPPQNSISPRNGDIKTDGKKIFIFWTKQNITAGDILTFSASYTLAEQRDSPINTLLILPIIVILAALAWFALKHKKSTKAVENAAVSVLSREEKILFDILKAHAGKVNQKVLVRESNFSKAKVSRLIKDLKERGVIEIEPVSGRENKIILKLGQEKKGKQEMQAPPAPDKGKETL